MPRPHPPGDAPRPHRLREPDSSASLRLQPHREPCLKASDLAAQPRCFPWTQAPGHHTPRSWPEEQSPSPSPSEQSGDAAPFERDAAPARTSPLT